MANANANANTLQGNTQNFTLNTDKSWYFYNTTTKTLVKRNSRKCGVAVSWRTTGGV